MFFRCLPSLNGQVLKFVGMTSPRQDVCWIIVAPSAMTPCAVSGGTAEFSELGSEDLVFEALCKISVAFCGGDAAFQAAREETIDVRRKYHIEGIKTNMLLLRSILQFIVDEGLLACIELQNLGCCSGAKSIAQRQRFEENFPRQDGVCGRSHGGCGD